MVQAIKSGNVPQAGVCSSVILVRALNAASLRFSGKVEDIIVAVFAALASQIGKIAAEPNLSKDSVAKGALDSDASPVRSFQLLCLILQSNRKVERKLYQVATVLKACS